MATQRAEGCDREGGAAAKGGRCRRTARCLLKGAPSRPPRRLPSRHGRSTHTHTQTSSACHTATTGQAPLSAAHLACWPLRRSSSSPVASPTLPETHCTCRVHRQAPQPHTPRAKLSHTHPEGHVHARVRACRHTHGVGRADVRNARGAPEPLRSGGGRRPQPTPPHPDACARPTVGAATAAAATATTAERSARAVSSSPLSSSSPAAATATTVERGARAVSSSPLSSSSPASASASCCAVGAEGRVEVSRATPAGPAGGLCACAFVHAHVRVCVWHAPCPRIERVVVAAHVCQRAAAPWQACGGPQCRQRSTVRLAVRKRASCYNCAGRRGRLTCNVYRRCESFASTAALPSTRARPGGPARPCPWTPSGRR